jgi:hypothetical protein
MRVSPAVGRVNAGWLPILNSDAKDAAHFNSESFRESRTTYKTKQEKLLVSPEPSQCAGVLAPLFQLAFQIAQTIKEALTPQPMVW